MPQYTLIKIITISCSEDRSALRQMHCAVFGPASAVEKTTTTATTATLT